MTPQDHQLGTRSDSKAAVTMASAAAVGRMCLPFRSHSMKQQPPWYQRLHHTLPPRVGRAMFKRTSRVFSPAQRVRTGMHKGLAIGAPSWSWRVPPPVSA